MKSILVLFSSVVYVLGYGETIQHVEYHLPKVAENWTIENKLESPKGITLLYTPEGIGSYEEESFAVSSTNLLSDPTDSESIKLSLIGLFPSLSIDFRVLETQRDSLTYEWSAQESGIEKIHGFGRAFSNEYGSVLLGYQTENIPNVDQARSIWLPVLKAAQQN